MSDERAIIFLERYRTGKTPADILGKKFQQNHLGHTSKPPLQS
jgi:hypothetical protein